MSMITNKFDFTKVKLGKGPAKKDTRTLMFADYLKPKAELPTAPQTYNWEGNITNFGMMANDTLGDCTIAAMAHLVMAFTDANNHLITPGVSEVIKVYSAITGYNPVTGSGDNGAVEIDVLNYWRKNSISGQRIEGYAAINVAEPSEIQLATYLFGGIYIGIALPITAQTQEIWDVVGDGQSGDSAPGSWGGHAVCVLEYDSTYLTVITWGAPLKMTWAFWNAYVDEAYGIISWDFFNKNTDISPLGFSLKSLEADLKAIG